MGFVERLGPLRRHDARDWGHVTRVPATTSAGLLCTWTSFDGVPITNGQPRGVPTGLVHAPSQDLLKMIIAGDKLCRWPASTEQLAPQCYKDLLIGQGKQGLLICLASELYSRSALLVHLE